MCGYLVVDRNYMVLFIQTSKYNYKLVEAKGVLLFAGSDSMKNVEPYVLCLHINCALEIELSVIMIR